MPRASCSTSIWVFMNHQEAQNHDGSGAEKSILTDVSEPLQFFNYHEYLADPEAPLNIKLVVNHFPDFDHDFESKKKALFESSGAPGGVCRIVRIPRVYHTIQDSDIIPQFSPAVPGTEDAALTDNNKNLTPRGDFDGSVFGVTSVTPLVPGLLLELEFIDIVTKINGFLFAALNPFAWENVVDSILDIATFTVYSKLRKNRHERRKLQELEDYVTTTNEYLKTLNPHLALISPRRCGYLSVSNTIALQPSATNPARLSDTQSFSRRERARTIVMLISCQSKNLLLL